MYFLDLKKAFWTNQSADDDDVGGWIWMWNWSVGEQTNILMQMQMH